MVTSMIDRSCGLVYVMSRMWISPISSIRSKRNNTDGGE